MTSLYRVPNEPTLSLFTCPKLSLVKQAGLRDFADTEMPATFSTILPPSPGENQRTLQDRILVPLLGGYGEVI